MSKYIDTAYPDVTQDPRLACILKLMKALDAKAESVEWAGKDATALRQQRSRLKARHNDGAIYEPQF
jgi:hypothetical protein